MDLFLIKVLYACSVAIILAWLAIMETENCTLANVSKAFFWPIIVILIGIKEIVKMFKCQ